jgi:hypothetical protein
LLRRRSSCLIWSTASPPPPAPSPPPARPSTTCWGHMGTQVRPPSPSHRFFPCFRLYGTLLLFCPVPIPLLLFPPCSSLCPVPDLPLAQHPSPPSPPPTYTPAACGKALCEGGLDVLYCSHSDGSLSLWRRRPRLLTYTCLGLTRLLPPALKFGAGGGLAGQGSSGGGRGWGRGVCGAVAVWVVAAAMGACTCTCIHGNC